MQGPNIKRLMIYKMSLLMVPPGTKNGFATGLAALAKPGNIGAVAHEATQWVEQAISLVKTAPDNPYGEDDEAIAGEILRKLDEKKRRNFNF